MRSTDEYQPQKGQRTGGTTLRDAITGQPVGGYDAADFEKQATGRPIMYATDMAAQIKSPEGQRSVKAAEGWRGMLPPGSKWEPGMLGKFDCAMCVGLGWVRFELPLGHPMQGKLAACECRRIATYPRLKADNAGAA